jgi:hypothetical protein
MVAVISLLLPGIAVGQKKYQRPIINAPQTFRSADTTAQVV